MAAAEVSNDQNTQTDRNTVMPYNSSLLSPCREILQSSDPGASFRKASHAEVWAVEKDSSGTKTAVVLTGPQLVSTGMSVRKVIILASFGIALFH